jgi:hypothetical protein
MGKTGIVFVSFVRKITGYGIKITLPPLAHVRLQVVLPAS